MVVPVVMVITWALVVTMVTRSVMFTLVTAVVVFVRRRMRAMLRSLRP